MTSYHNTPFEKELSYQYGYGSSLKSLARRYGWRKVRVGLKRVRTLQQKPLGSHHWKGRKAMMLGDTMFSLRMDTDKRIVPFKQVHDETIYICEGELDAIQLHNKTGKTCIVVA